MTAGCSDLQLWILGWEESLLPFTSISLLTLLGKSQRRNLIDCLGHVLITKPITVIKEEALVQPSLDHRPAYSTLGPGRQGLFAKGCGPSRSVLRKTIALHFSPPWWSALSCLSILSQPQQGL